MLHVLLIVLAALTRFTPIQCRGDTTNQQWFTAAPSPAMDNRANLTVGRSWEALGPFPMSVVNGVLNASVPHELT
jgi:hypothetical protein